MTIKEATGAARTSFGSVLPFPSRGSSVQRDFWIAEGLRLSLAEHDLPWQCGDWWNLGATLGHGVRKRIVTSKEWIDAGGLAHKTMRNRGSVAKRFSQMSRQRDLSFDHHAAVCCLDDVQATVVLDEAAECKWSAKRTHTEAMRLLNGYYQKFSGDVVHSLPDLVARGERFNALGADPPWETEYPVLRGGSGAHYESMDLTALGALPVAEVSLPTSTLFLWCPHIRIQEAFWLMDRWGFADSGSEIIWRKIGKIGTGFRARMIHEHLLVGIREQAPLWDGVDIPSVIDAERGKHSEKPDIFYEIIERAVPGPRLELFGRKERDGWTVCGDQIK